MRKGRPRIHWHKLVLSIRRRANITQAQMAELLNATQPAVSNWEWAMTEPQAKFKRKLEVLA